MRKTAAAKPVVARGASKVLEERPSMSCPQDEINCPCGQALICRVGVREYTVWDNCFPGCESPVPDKNMLLAQGVEILEDDIAACDCLFKVCCVLDHSGGT